MAGERERESGIEAGRREMVVGVDDVEFAKARTDKREYRRVVLSNSLEVLLISDPDTDKAAACMSVDVGSFCNPEGLEGLAHFLGKGHFWPKDDRSEPDPLFAGSNFSLANHGEGRRLGMARVCKRETVRGGERSGYVLLYLVRRNSERRQRFAKDQTGRV